MMQINQNTRINKLLKYNPAALEAIVGIHPRFEKLRNPALRKIMASRTSIAMASRVGGCSVTDFYEALKPLGFTVQQDEWEDSFHQGKKTVDFFKNLSPDQIKVMDVRPILDNNEDPFKRIMKSVNNLNTDEALKIINTFEPTPLIGHLEKKGFEAVVDHISDNYIETWIYKKKHIDNKENDPENISIRTEGWDEIISRYANHLQEIDVRDLEAPIPMMTILEHLETLSVDQALFVYHKKIPLFLLPELQQKQLDYRIKEIGEEEVHVLIFKAD